MAEPGGVRPGDRTAKAGRAAPCREPGCAGVEWTYTLSVVAADGTEKAIGAVRCCADCGTQADTIAGREVNVIRGGVLDPASVDARYPLRGRV